MYALLDGERGGQRGAGLLRNGKAGKERGLALEAGPRGADGVDLGFRLGSTNYG